MGDSSYSSATQGMHSEGHTFADMKGIIRFMKRKIHVCACHRTNI